MKCVRCGTLLQEQEIVCSKCGYDMVEHVKLEEMYKEMQSKSDPDIDPKQKSSLVDNPLLTFVFGLLSMMIPMLALVDFGIFRWVALALGYVVCFLTFHMAKKPAKVSLETVRNFGNFLGYVGFVFTVFLTVYLVWGVLS